MNSNLLIADADPVLLLTFGRFLDQRDFLVTKARDVKEALACLRACTFRVVITDLVFRSGPPADGFVVIDEVRRRSPEAIVVVHTAYRTPATDEMAAERGVALVLDKPAPLPWLADEICRLVSR